MSQRIVEVKLAGSNYGLEVSGVVTAIKRPKISPLPGSPPFVTGVANMRGTLLPILDLAPWLGLRKPAASGAGTAVIVLKSEELEAGLLVERLVGIVTIPDHRIVRAPVIGPERTLPYLREAAQTESGMLVIFDAPAYLRDSAGKLWESAA